MDFQSTVPRSGVTVAWAAALWFVAWAVFGVGLISPLTPSEGHPSTLELAAFVGIPVALFGISVGNVRARWARVSAIVQLVLVVIAASYVVSLTFR